ncbi:MAG TPA: RNA polymerase sigma factor [Propionicimonas sp.]|nr:RNA polymerase sigma factor [Propionicimonas sp.]
MPIGPRFPEVLRAASDGVEGAWSELYREFAPQLLRFLRAQGATDPEDLLGDCFVQIVRKLGDFSGDETGFRTWVFLIARNRLVDEWRRADRRPTVLRADPLVAASTPATIVPGADEAAIGRAGLDEILGRLTPDQRAVISLRFVDRFSLAETAEILGRSEGSVKLLQHRAIRALRRDLA